MDDKPVDLRTISKIISCLQRPTKEGKPPPTSKEVITYERELSKPVEKFVTGEQATLESNLVLRPSEDKTPESRCMTLGTRVGIKRKLSKGPAVNLRAKRQTVLDLASDEKSKDNQRLLSDPNCNERATVDYSSPDKHGSRFYATSLPSASLSSSIGMLPDEKNIVLDLTCARRDGISAVASTSTGVSRNRGCESSQDYSTRAIVDYCSPNSSDKHSSRCHTTTLPSTSLSSSIGMFPYEKNKTLDLECDNNFKRDHINAETSTSAGVSGNRDFARSQVSSRNHNQVSPFECAICSECFSHEVKFMFHLEMHGKPFICKFCYIEFKTFGVFIRHYRLHHDYFDYVHQHYFTSQ